MKDYSKLITVDPAKRSGQPCIRNLRITVADIISYIQSGMTTQEILNDFPNLTLDDIEAAIWYNENK